jgi:hypothetical protein
VASKILLFRRQTRMGVNSEFGERLPNPQHQLPGECLHARFRATLARTQQAMRPTFHSGHKLRAGRARGVAGNEAVHGRLETSLLARLPRAARRRRRDRGHPPERSYRAAPRRAGLRGATGEGAAPAARPAKRRPPRPRGAGRAAGIPHVRHGLTSPGPASSLPDFRLPAFPIGTAPYLPAPSTASADCGKVKKDRGLHQSADVAKLADAPDLGSGPREGVGVQVSSSAPITGKPAFSLADRHSAIP